MRAPSSRRSAPSPRVKLYRLDVALAPDLLGALDIARGLVPRATFVRALIEKALARRGRAPRSDPHLNLGGREGHEEAE